MSDEPKPARPKVLYSVGLPVSSDPCRYCDGRIVWSKTATGANMPLSWSTREALVEDGRHVGYTMEPHFGDCPNWPGRSKKARGS